MTHKEWCKSIGHNDCLVDERDTTKSGCIFCKFAYEEGQRDTAIEVMDGRGEYGEMTHEEWCKQQRGCVRPNTGPCHQCKNAYETAQKQIERKAGAAIEAMDEIVEHIHNNNLNDWDIVIRAAFKYCKATGKF